MLKLTQADGQSATRDSRPCIVCGRRAVEVFLDLGSTALANKFLTGAELATPEPAFPLRVGFCRDCGHVQLAEAVPPGLMFEDYLYVSSASDTLRAHLYDLSDYLVRRFRLGAEDLVIDIGCNDGTLLSRFRDQGIRTLGVDPAKNLAELTKDMGIERYVGFFNAETAGEIAGRWGKASVVTATNTFPHIPDLHGFARGLDTALRPGGVFVAEMHYLLDLLEQGAFDTVYHEHISYWALGPMQRLFERNGMRVVDAERVPLHHGQLRVFVQRKDEGHLRPGVEAILAAERAHGLHRFETFKRFADGINRTKTDLRRTLAELERQGKKVAGYGAPAKASTLLAFLELGPETLKYIVDKSPLKQGLYMPGCHIPIVSPARLTQDPPDYLLLLAWNFADEILEQQRAFRERGGRFIIPVPAVRIV
jgi:SAM-dependent methyltransferase